MLHSPEIHEFARSRNNTSLIKCNSHSIQGRPQIFRKTHRVLSPINVIFSNHPPRSVVLFSSLAVHLISPLPTSCCAVHVLCVLHSSLSLSNPLFLFHLITLSGFNWQMAFPLLSLLLFLPSVQTHTPILRTAERERGENSTPRYVLCGRKCFRYTVKNSSYGVQLMLSQVLHT